ncbi:MAG: fructokinase [bacterium]|jgi:fructokinase
MNRIGVDLGGTKTEIILTNDTAKQVLYRKRISTQQEKGYKHILNQIADLIREAQNLSQVETKIGIGIPGSISPTTGKVRNANTQCLIGQDLKGDLENLIQQTIVIENDANCFALSEAILGAGKNHSVVAGIIMGTGMGGGLVAKQKLWTGLQGVAGEWGHSSIDYDGPECWCGQRGCLELFLSGTGIQNLYFQKSGQKKTLQEIYTAFLEKSDLIAIQSIEQMCVHFGRGMANLIATFDPEVIILGGGVSNIPILYTKGVEETYKQLFNDELKTPIVKNQLGDSSGVFGAALLAD